MHIAVVGTGYVGLVTGTCLAETGNRVICVDIDAEKVRKMQEGVVPIYEPHLDVIFERNIKQGRLTFTTRLEEAVAESDIIFLALPTPPGEDGSADLSYILGVADHLGKIMTDYKIIIDKSTVPVGTADLVREAVAKNFKGEFDVVSNPEFLREGFAVDDFMKPDRVVIGTRSERAKKVLEELYKPYTRQGNPILFMDERSAEVTKYAANSFLAMKISFMNEMANLCERVGADVDSVRLGIGSDDRIGKRFLFPGIGYGGSCFPKDVQALAQTSSQYGYDFKILKSVMEVNATQKSVLVEKIKNRMGSDLSGKKFAVWGISFKPDTDDIREAPSLEIMEALTAAGAEVCAYDPEGMENAKKQHPGLGITYSENAYDALNGADALVIATEWSQFRSPDFDELNARLKNRLIFDGRNIYSLESMRELGYEYISIGREIIKSN
ncbi:MAG: UDP-glucose/GDP-mannose dehydrogenase family protein [Flavobacteriales bacterium]|nr:UDP-glucose/GDP-mannose dehydrogenase family protein [Flavobacteriales bacterium]